MSDILALAQAHGHGPFKKKGDDHHRSCFECGGKDRFWINPNGGKQNRGRYACRQCDISGNAVEYGVSFCNLTWDEAYAFLGLTRTRNEEGLTLDAYSRDKGIPPWLLEERNIRPEGNSLLFPYYYRDGTEARPQMRATSGKQWWKKGDEREIIVYGADVLGHTDEVALVEGVSDWLTLHYNKFSVLAVPGASMHRKLKADDIQGVRRVLIVKEADQSNGGEVFERNAKKRLVELGFTGEVFVVDMKKLGAKDPNELYQKDREGFPVVWQKAMDRAAGRISGPIGTILSDVVRRPVRWIWPGHLALGKITIMDGHPGLGKSTVYTDYIARFTAGGNWPDETPIYEAGNAVIITTEDGMADTILPRLEEMGGSPGRVRVIGMMPEVDGPGRMPELLIDVEVIMRQCEEDGARLLVIDPFVAYLGEKSNSYRDQDVRRVLAPLAEAAERAGVAVLLIRHLNKSGGGAAILRGGGSIGIIAGARIGLFVGEDPEDPDLRVVACQKNNLAKKPPSIAYRVVSSPNDPSIGIIKWEGTSALTADDLCRPPAVPLKTEQAEEWIKDYLNEGPKSSDDIIRDGKTEGFCRSTLFKVKKALGIEAKKVGFQGSWEWTMPNRPKTTIQAKSLITTDNTLCENGTGGKGAQTTILTGDGGLVEGSDPWDSESTADIEGDND